MVVNTTDLNDTGSKNVVSVEEDFDYILNKEQKEIQNKEKGIF